MIAMVALRRGTLAPPPRTERMSELSDREDAFPGVALDLLLADPSKEANVILLYRLIVAALPELADLAVVVQDQPRRRTRTGHLFDIAEESFGPPQVRAEPDRCGLALLPVPDHPVGGQSPLDLGKKQAVYLQQELLLLSYLPPLVEQH